MAVTLAEVARHAGVSPQTVSNALSNPGILKASTLERVQQAIAELGYTPNLRARMLRQQRTGSIGMRIRPVGDNVAAVLTDRLLHELSTAATSRDKHILLYTASDDADEVEVITRLNAQGLVDEFILTDTHPDDLRVRELSARGLSFVAFGRPWSEGSEHAWIDVDGRAGLARATTTLIELGHTRIGFLGWPAGSSTGDDRRSGWVETTRTRLGYSEQDHRQLTVVAPENISAAIEIAPTLLAREVDAVVCASDSLAMGMVAAVRTSGRTLPVVGFDNTPLAASLGFSSIDQDLATVAQQLLACLDDPGSATTLTKPRLVAGHDPRWGLPRTATGHCSPRKDN